MTAFWVVTSFYGLCTSLTMLAESTNTILRESLLQLVSTHILHEVNCTDRQTAQEASFNLVSATELVSVSIHPIHPRPAVLPSRLHISAV